MNGAGALPDILGAAIGTVLTLLIFSYMLGDNPLYRLTLHIFMGALIGYSFSIVIAEIMISRLLTPLSTLLVAQDSQSAENLLVVVPLILSVLLLVKGVRRQAYIGNMATGLLIGVGAAVALSGALLGTLIPQVAATGSALSLEGVDLSQPDGWLVVVRGALIVLGTVCTLMAFSFASRKQRGLAGLWSGIVAIAGGIGKLFLTSALAMAFAAALTSALSLLTERIYSIIDFIAKLFTPS